MADHGDSPTPDYNGSSVTVIRRIDQAQPAVVYGLLAILLAAVFVPMSLYRLVDGDEGTSLLVSRLVVEGQLPYHDFFYPQMFLLPYVYGGWMKLVGYSWYGARLLSAVFSIALGLLVYRQAARLAGARAWGVLAVVLFTFSSLAFGWYPLIKTFVFPSLLLFAAYAVLSSASRWRWVASGFLLGLATDCRVYLIAVVPAFILELYLTEEDPKRRLMQFARFAIGLALALLPNELFLLIDPRTFVFNIVDSQVIRTDVGLLGWMDQRSGVVEQLLAINSAEGVMSFQFLVIFVLNLVSWVSDALSRESVGHPGHEVQHEDDEELEARHALGAVDREQLLDDAAPLVHPAEKPDVRPDDLAVDDVEDERARVDQEEEFVWQQREREADREPRELHQAALGVLFRQIELENERRDDRDEVDAAVRGE